MTHHWRCTSLAFAEIVLMSRKRARNLGVVPPAVNGYFGCMTRLSEGGEGSWFPEDPCTIRSSRRSPVGAFVVEDGNRGRETRSAAPCSTTGSRLTKFAPIHGDRCELLHHFPQAGDAAHLPAGHRAKAAPDLYCDPRADRRSAIPVSGDRGVAAGAEELPQAFLAEIREAARAGALPGGIAGGDQGDATAA